MKLSGWVELVSSTDEEVVVTKNGWRLAVPVSLDEVQISKEALVMGDDA
jgi:hypothetical protein